jgi:hypothetical protein
MQAFGDVLALAYVILLASVTVYWPLQAVALIVSRGNDRMIGLGILAFTLLVFASFGGGPDMPNFPPLHVVVLVAFSNLALMALMVHAFLVRRQ